MKCLFTVDGTNYLAPSKKEARRFIKFFPWVWWNEPKRFKTTWKLRHIERAASYGQMNRVDLSQVEYDKYTLREKEQCL